MEFVIMIFILIMSVVVHEVAHGYAALALGDPTAKYAGRLTLNPLKHLDFVGSFLVPFISYQIGGFIVGWAKPVPFNPYNLRNQKWGEAIVAISGPLSNLILALIFGLAIRITSDYWWDSAIYQSFFGMAGFVVLINITLAIFNLIPIPPLDGSKILFTFLPYNKWQALREFFEKYGLILVFFLVFFFWRFVIQIVVFLFRIFVGG
ncbi:MAG: site-2 protease family protein [Parcubacteria group bacterium]|nr:site-2 protease family protein [Parcubacteria group bacterium]